MKRLLPVCAQHLLQLHDLQVISDEEILPYFIKDGKIHFDPNILTDLGEVPNAYFNNVAGFPVQSVQLNIKNARCISMQLHDKQMVTNEQIREYFGIGQLVPSYSDHLIHLLHVGVITRKEFEQYIFKDGKLNLDPSLLIDLQDDSYDASSFVNMALPAKSPKLNKDAANTLVLLLHSHEEILTKEQVREWFAIGGIECYPQCGSGIDWQVPTIPINGPNTAT